MGSPAPVHEKIVSEKAAKRMRGTRTGRRLIAAAGFIGALAAGVIGFVVIGGAGSRPPLLSTYTFASVRYGRLDEAIFLHGTLHLEGSKPLIAPQGGVVEEVFVKEGEEIRQGGRIALISSESL
jgi:multidrug efflux pump subunit AcrA (membrane-fusion protein)